MWPVIQRSKDDTTDDAGRKVTVGRLLEMVVFGGVVIWIELTLNFHLILTLSNNSIYTSYSPSMVSLKTQSTQFQMAYPLNLVSALCTYGQ